MKLKYIILLCIAFAANAWFVVAVQLECPWKKNFGIDCPGCGSTRMIKAILRLDFYQAFRYNPLIFSLCILGIIYLIYVFICKMLKKKYFVFGFKSSMLLVGLLIAFMVLRNISMFDFLRPTIVG